MEGYQSFGQSNYDPASQASLTSSVILMLLLVDESGSINHLKDGMNTAMNEIFMQEFKNSHRKDDIMIKKIAFASTVTHKSGFMPIMKMDNAYLDIPKGNGGTALYEAVLQGIDHVTDYRKALELQGVDVRCNIFIVTDGDDTTSGYGASGKVKTKIEELRRNEMWATSFTFNMLGIGDRPDIFTNSCIAMGLEPAKVLSTVTTDVKKIREQMGVVSKSASSSNQSTVITF